MPPFKEWKFKDAQDAVSTAIKGGTNTDIWFKSNSRFVEDKDHWQSGDTWVGPDGGTNSPLRTTILKAVERQFTPIDVIGEVLDNVANALLNKEADVSFAPLVAPEDPESESAKQLTKEADAMRDRISGWWDKQKLWEKARQATRRSRWSSRGALRTWIAPSTLQKPTAAGGQATLPTNLKFDEALSKVLLSAPTPDNCYVVTDPETNERAAVRLFKREEKSFAEIWFVTEEKTVARIVGESTDKVETYEVQLGGRLPIAEMEAEVLITEPVRRQQNRLNFFETLLVRVGETAGFPERYTTNAKPQGVWLTTPPTNAPPLETFSDGDKTWYLHATPRTLGAAITTDLRGITTRDEQGRETIATPGVEFKEPTDPEYAIKASDHARKTILRNCKQAHLAMESSAEASGIAYVQARAAFEKDLGNTKAPLEGMLRDIIEVVIAWAELMSGVGAGESFLKKFRCVVNLHVNSGPITAEEKQSNALMVEKNMLSRETGMAANGVEDVAAELQAIDNDPAVKRVIAKAIGDAMNALTTAGAGKKAAAKLIGMSDDDAKAFAESQFTESAVQQ